MTILKTDQLTKYYGGLKVVKNVNLQIEESGVYGLIGKNGAGKTTLMRMLAGLTFPDSGKITIGGKSDPKGLAQNRRKMSFIIETPYFSPSLTAYQNMNMQRIQRGVADKSCIERLLKLVSLDKTGSKKAANFSLGMKQRLGIAIAMISDPKLLVLDEPINGLDPEGIVEMRKLILDINQKYNITLLISSHLLSELYQTASCFIIMHEGEIIEQFNKNELEEKCDGRLIVKVAVASKGADVLRSKLNSSTVEYTGDYITIYSPPEDISLIPQYLVESGNKIYSFECRQLNLEEYFMSLTGGN